MHPLAAAKAVDPAQPLHFDSGRLGFGTHQHDVARTMRLAKGVPTGDQRHGFSVIHRHPGKGFADIPGRGQRVRVAIRPLWVHIDQAHLHGSQRVFQLPVASIALVIQPDILGSPINILLRLPDIGPTAAKAKGLQSHRIQRAVSSQHHQVCP